MNAISQKFVAVEGPFEDFDRHDNEVMTWTVCVINERNEEFSRVYRCGSKSRALDLADKIARDRRLAVEVDCA